MQYYNPSFLSSCPLYTSGAAAGSPSFRERNQLERDVRYMKRYYPNDVRRLAEITTYVVDRYDTRSSFIYDEFPDRISTLHILHEILTTEQAERVLPPSSDTAAAPASMDEECRRTIAELLLSHEIFLRRMKHGRGYGIYL